MSSHVMLTHTTRYRYDRPVFLGPQTIRLRPSGTARTPVRSYALRVDPVASKQSWHQDGFGNNVAEVVFAERVTHFDITVRLEADLTPRNPFDFTLAPAARRWTPPVAFATTLSEESAPAQHQQQAMQQQQQACAIAGSQQAETDLPACPHQFYTPEEQAKLALYRATPPAGPHLHAFLTDWVEKAPRDTLDMLVALNRALAARIGYQLRLEPGVWSPEETLARGVGSCRDSAWLMIALLRHLGFAARFVSGYLIQSSQTAEGEEALTCDLHAWAEAFLPGAGWVGFDTTSGLLTAQGHLPLAATPAPEQAAPVTGLLDQCKATFDVSMQTDRLVMPDSV
ncbi:transglutaminase family protein [Acetobacter sp. KSO5]|uniref:transglutaminase family protein n=1 Tax=Acetobacter sp. KSO5 TaxID=3373674 RepID=UPI00242B902A|nr:transglutaminase family protein [Acetobacter syzygii]